MPGDVVNETGDSIAELAPCEHPLGGNKWKNHGAFMKVVAHTSEAEKDAIVFAAGQSECRHKN